MGDCAQICEEGYGVAITSRDGEEARNAAHVWSRNLERCAEATDWI